MDYRQVFLLSVGLLLGGGLICYLLGGIYRRAAGPLAVLCSLGALVLGVVLLTGPAGTFGYRSFTLLGSLTAMLEFRVGPFIGLLNALALLFGFCIILYSLSYWRSEADTSRWYAFALWAVAGTSVALLTRHLLLFLFAWEMVTVMLYLLVGVGGPKARAGAAKSFSILGFSDVALILGLALLYARGGLQMLNIDHLQGAGRIHVAGAGDVGIYLLLLVAALAKAGAVPLHTWIPAAAEHAPLPTMALLPASLDKLLGIVLLARISLGFFALTSGLRVLLMLIGAVTIIAAVMMAMVQHDLRRLLSFHAVSQVGYMVLGIGTGVAVGVVGGLFHMVNHAVYKSLLFLGGGSVESRTGDLELDNLGGLARAMPLTATAFVIGALAISGVPPLNGFVSKWMVYQGVVETGGGLMPILLAAAVLGSALTLASFVKAIHSVFLGERSEAHASAVIREAPWNMLFPLGLLSGLCIVLGLWGGYAIRFFLQAGFQEFGQAPVVAGVEAAAEISSPIGFWGPWQAVALIFAGLFFGLILYALGRATRIRTVRSFVAGEVDLPAPTHYGASDFYQTVRELPVIRGFYGDAEREAFDVYRVAGQIGSGIVSVLRRLHSGVLETYVTWVIAGTALVVAMLFLLR